MKSINSTVIGVAAIFCLGFPAAGAAAETLRRVVSLDGVWQIGEGKKEQPPSAFDHTVPVPGLVDMATPPFVEPGPKVANPRKLPQSDPRREAFWYRRSFTLDGPVPDVATLRIPRATFGTRAILNGKLIGDHAPCFTPALFDARDALKTGVNELIIRVGADRDGLTNAVPAGYDYEKTRYIPGIFDSVELVLSKTPAIVNAQVAPDLARQEAKLRVWLKGTLGGDLTAEVREVKSRKIVGSGKTTLKPDAGLELDLTLPVEGCHLWTPEDPFLYELTVRTAGDEFTTRFGMREFRFDPATGRAMLNGKPYFMRGSNITLYRFLEDPERAALPWDESWVRKLHQQVKDMHWNCLRYCIGFPPEMWYRIADEEGILIQDEFPIWYGATGWDVTWPKELKTDELVREFTEWMRERWNHPCVVIWDACNETLAPEVAPAIAAVRGMDMSKRPWDNGYNDPQEPGDMFESHPYHFSKPTYRLSDLAKADPVPGVASTTKDKKHALVINEYGWLWLNRDGTPTTLTQELYQKLLGPDSTTEQRRHVYARYTAAETEFWRCHRKAAAVMHFTTLGYSRPDGQTSDHWADVKNLTWDLEFYQYVRDSFAPVGLMIDAWAENYPSGAQQQFPLVLINDLNEPWKGNVRFRILKNGASISEQLLPAEIPALGTTKLECTAVIPKETGDYQAEATLMETPAGAVRSLRDFKVLQPGAK